MKQLEASSRNGTEFPLHLLEAGLRDGDTTVRVFASSALAELQSAHSRVAPSTGRPPLELPPSLIQAISAALEDASRPVRGNATNALVFFWRGSASDLTGRLLERFANEPDPVIRGLLLTHLRNVGRSDRRLRSVLINATQDPATEVQQQAALGIAVHRPPGGLAAVARLLEAGDLKVRAAAVSAVAAYGKEATPHIPLLRLLRNSEQREPVKRVIEDAIARIERG